MGKLKVKKESSGIKIKNIHCFCMICSCVLCLCIFLTIILARKNYSKMFLSINDYTECNKAINQFRDASDFLTNEARLFSINLDDNFLENYFQEIEVLKDRDSAIQILELSHINDNPDIKLKMAFNESEYLRNVEMYSFKLIFESGVIKNEQLQAKLNYISLNENDALLDKNAKIQKAREMLFDANYLSSKERIGNFTSEALSSLVSSYLVEEKAGDEKLSAKFIFSFISILILLIVSVLIFVLIIIFVLNPLQKQIKNIELGKRMDLKGSYETRYIAKTYNMLIEKNEIKTSILKHKAEHDPLTGLINRNAFDQIKQILTESTEPIAYLLLDIDFFKKVNDDCGHLVGDEVLKKIANLLLDKFRNTDYVARIGGDEFAIIMTKFGQNPQQIIQTKIDILNNTMQSLADGLPSVSLSVGVAFSSCGFIKELESQADKALYRVKNGGRCNCSFYDYEVSNFYE